MKNKILLIIALVCMVVPFMVLGSTVSAEVISVEPVLRDFVLPQQVSGWVGLWQINLNALLVSGSGYNYVSVEFYSPFDVFFFSSTMAGSYYVNSVSVGFTINSVFVTYSDTTGDIDDSMDSSIEFYCYLYVPTNVVDSQTDVSVSVKYYYDGILVHPDVSLSGIPQNAFLRFDDPFLVGYNLGLDVGAGFDRDFVYQQGYNSGFQQSNNQVTVGNASYNAGYNAGVDVGVQQSNNQVTVGNASYNAGYNAGVDVGVQQSNNQVTVGNASYNAGVQYADNRVNKNSWSYQQGLTDGRAEGGEYTFLGLIGAILDAPINALFGYTSADGVFHPGLFSIEILGMNMSAFILSIFTLGLIIAILRLCLGGK